MFNALLDQKSGLKKFVRENHIRFRSNQATAMSLMARFYDQIPKQP
jgi:hypothetical protein